MYVIQPSAADIDLLTSIPFLNSPAVLNDLKAELPAYLAAAEDMDQPKLTHLSGSNQTNPSCQNGLKHVA